VLEHKSDNIYETRKVNIGGLYELTNDLSNGTSPDPLRPPLPQDWVLSQELLKQQAGTFKGSIRTKPIKNLEENGAWTYPGTVGLPKVFKYPLLSQERVQLWTLYLAGTFTRSIRTNAR